MTLHTAYLSLSPLHSFVYLRDRITFNSPETPSMFSCSRCAWTFRENGGQIGKFTTLYNKTEYIHTCVNIISLRSVRAWQLKITSVIDSFELQITLFVIDQVRLEIPITIILNIVKYISKCWCEFGPSRSFIMECLSMTKKYSFIIFCKCNYFAFHRDWDLEREKGKLENHRTWTENGSTLKRQSKLSPTVFAIFSDLLFMWIMAVHTPRATSCNCERKKNIPMSIHVSAGLFFVLSPSRFRFVWWLRHRGPRRL